MPDLLEALLVALRSASDVRITASPLSILEGLESFESGEHATAALALHRLSETLVPLIQTDSRFPGKSARMIRTINGASGFYPHFVAGPLLKKAIRTGSAEKAIEWLHKVLNAKSASGTTTRALWGVPVEREVQITSRVSLLPLAALPDSVIKRNLIAASSGESPIVSMLGWSPPTSALVTPHHIEPVIFDPKPGEDLPSKEFLDTCSLLDDITCALAAVGPRSPIPAAQWFAFDDPDLQDATIVNPRHSTLLEVHPSRPDNYPTLDPVEARLVVEGFLSLKGSDRTKLRIALLRLSQAQRRHSVGDAAVELATAFESLVGDSTNAEMTHKVKVRASKLIGGSADERKRNAAIIGKGYSIRSALVHTGSVDQSATETILGSKLKYSEIIASMAELCASLIRRLVQIGGVPDWSLFDVT